MSSLAPLHAELQQKLAETREKRAFDVADWVEKKTDMFNEYMTRCGLKACVVSVSGGVDSAVTLALMKHAAKKEGSPIERTVGIAQPIHSTATIQDRAFELGPALDVEIITVDQSSLHTELCKRVEDAIGVEGQGFARGQLRSYMRTPVNFFTAQLLSQNGTPCIVMGTGNYDEDGYLLYFCKAGDGVADVQLIADIHKSEVFTVGQYLGVPDSILKAAPSADLWDGQTDEDELGFSYDFVELYTEYLKLDESSRRAFKETLCEEALKEFESLGAKADAIHNRNKHKQDCPLNLNVLE